MSLEDIAIQNRKLDALGLSIATDLGIAGALGKHPERPLPKPPVVGYDLLLINIRTLVRNFLESVGRDKITLISRKASVTLFYEVYAIMEMIHSETQGKTKVGFYYSKYRDLEKKFPHAKLKYPETKLQIAFQGIQDEVSKWFAEDIRQHNEKNKTSPILFKEVDMLLDDGHFDKTLIMTHLPIDLLAHKHFTNLVLLESHTGNTKNSFEWYTKLTRGKELPPMPFNAFTLQVFGDNGTFFSPLGIKIKNTLVEVIKTRKWTPSTTMDRIRFSVEQINDVDIRNTLLTLL